MFTIQEVYKYDLWPKIMEKLKSTVASLLHKADIRINGDRAWDIRIKNDDLYQRVIREGSLGLGEAYMDGWWEADALDEFFFHLLRAQLDRDVSWNLQSIGFFLTSLLQNRQSEERAHQIGVHHYDTGNDLFKAMLDERMVYTCGYWLDDTDNLEDAQQNKLEMVCQKLGLSAGDRVLDIGCGWGSFARYAAQNYEVSVVGVTVSGEQKELAAQRCKDLPVEIRLQDYRELNEPFDHVVSLGMFEHVGVKNYRTYMQTVARCLADSGTFVLHTIGGNRSVNHTDPWIEKYIFPNSMIPSMRQISRAIEDLFVMEDWDNYGPHYDRTLMAWYQRFNDHWDTLSQHYSDRFYRMWKYYLLCSAGSFRARKNHQWQIVLTKNGHVF